MLRLFSPARIVCVCHRDGGPAVLYPPLPQVSQACQQGAGSVPSRVIGRPTNHCHLSGARTALHFLVPVQASAASGALCRRLTAAHLCRAWIVWTERVAGRSLCQGRRRRPTYVAAVRTGIRWKAPAGPLPVSTGQVAKKIGPRPYGNGEDHSAGGAAGEVDLWWGVSLDQRGHQSPFRCRTLGASQQG